MFTTVIAWVVFIYVTFCIPFWIHQIVENANNPFFVLNTQKLVGLLIIWFLAGWKLFG